jgi:succinylglutamate desuccinylase
MKLKIAIIGGTHGNEPVGIEVMENLKKDRPATAIHAYECFLANPLAYIQKKRFVDTDLNRSFGPKGTRLGNEEVESARLTKEIKGHFDFVLDLHTTTSNMGLTVLLNNDSQLTRQAAARIQEVLPEVKIIEGMKMNEDCPYTSNLIGSGLTIEVGPVANNVLDGQLILDTKKMVMAILEWDFEEEYDLSSLEYFKSFGEYKFPVEKGWYIHPELEKSDFKELAPGDPVFINMDGEVKGFEGEEVIVPFFINEAAYQDDALAMTMSLRKFGFS